MAAITASPALRLRSILPEGRSLPDAAWRSRHRALLGLLWLHSPAVAGFALAKGYSIPHSLFEGGGIAAIAAVATLATASTSSRKVCALLVSGGLMTSSAAVVHVSGGYIEAHFHFFVMTALLLLYEDWLPYLTAFGYVVFHHGLVGALDPGSVYNHAGGIEHPWRWALVHGMFISALGVANVVNWRLNENVRGDLKESEERFRDLFESSTDMVCRADTEGRIVEINRAGEELTGYSRDELLGRQLLELVPEELQESVLEQIERKLGGETDETVYEAELLTRDGNRVPIEVASRVIREGGRPVALQAQVRDESGRKQLEAQLRQSQKLEAIGRLAGGIAHDFNNLLLAISGYSDFALRRLSQGKSAEEDIEEVKKAADRAAGLTAQLLAFGRRQVLLPEMLSLNSVAVDTESLLRRLIGEHIELKVSLDHSLGRVQADPSQIEQVIVNLAVNARDAMPSGGTLTIETRNVELDDVYFRQLGQEGTPGPYVMLAITDTGCGMDPETKASIFEPFFTTKAVGQGTGLGLATVYGVVKQSGGYIWVYSEPGAGTSFKIYLPRAADATAVVQEAVPGPVTPRGEETVLLVEDEDVVRRLVREILEDSGYTVLAADRGPVALELVEHHEGAIDLMVTDVVMPEMSGRELAERMAHVRPEMKVLYMSGYTGETVLYHGIEGEGISFLQKPFAGDDLARRVRELLDQAPRAA